MEERIHFDPFNWVAYVLDFSTFVDCQEAACIRPLIPFPFDESHGIWKAMNIGP